MLDLASLPLAQVEIRDRSGGDCVTDNGAFCFDWLSDN